MLNALLHGVAAGAKDCSQRRAAIGKDDGAGGGLNEDDAGGGAVVFYFCCQMFHRGDQVFGFCADWNRLQI